MCRITVITSVFNCEQFLEGYFRAVEKVANKNELEILLLHNAPQQPEIQIINKYLRHLTFVKHIIIPNREGLYATWNRGVKLAKGKYIAIWNTDDIRLPFSLSDQANILDENPYAAMSYGDFTIVGAYGNFNGRQSIEPEFKDKPKSFLRKHHIGCFPMWRKEIHDDIGYFDEQFKLVADLDFQIRVSSKYPLIKAKKELGYYLENTPSNLSSNRKLQRTERTALNMRYGNYDLLHLPYLYSSLKKINISKIEWSGNFYNIDDWLVSRRNHSVKKGILIFRSLFNLPLDILRYIKYASPKT